MAQVESPLVTVREWQRKGFELTNQSQDRLLSLMTKACETMADLLANGSNRDHILCSLLTLDSQRAIAMRFENTSSDGVRTLSYGVIQCLQLTLLELIENHNSNQKEKTDCIPKLTVDESTQTEIAEDAFTESNDNPSTSNSADGEDLTLPSFTLVTPKPEQFDNNASTFHTDQINNLLIDNTTYKEEEMLESNMTSYSDNQFIYGDDGEDRADFDIEEEEDIDYQNVQSTSQPSAKKRKSAREVDPARTIKPSDTPIPCPEPGCDYETRKMTTWLTHLRSKHNTTPDLANVALKCECGHICHSWTHSARCDLANYVVVRKRDGPIRRIDRETTRTREGFAVDERMNSKCFFDGCKKFPNSLVSYTEHISRSHNQTLLKEGYSLRCECGVHITSRNASYKHVQICSMKNFTLHKLNDNERNI